jgi:hypothetical protein
MPGKRGGLHGSTQHLNSSRLINVQTLGKRGFGSDLAKVQAHLSRDQMAKQAKDVLFRRDAISAEILP